VPTERGSYTAEDDGRRAIPAVRVPVSTVRARVRFPRGSANSLAHPYDPPSGGTALGDDGRSCPRRQRSSRDQICMQSYGGGAQLGWRSCSLAPGFVLWAVRSVEASAMDSRETRHGCAPPVCATKEEGAATDAWARRSSEGPIQRGCETTNDAWVPRTGDLSGRLSDRQVGSTRQGGCTRGGEEFGPREG
jgi:hypothetical protein